MIFFFIHQKTTFIWIIEYLKVILISFKKKYLQFIQKSYRGFIKKKRKKKHISNLSYKEKFKFIKNIITYYKRKKEDFNELKRDIPFY